MSTPYHAKLYAHDLTKRLSSESLEKLTSVLADARVDMNPHQVEAALFAFKSPLSKGAILAEEVGLGKTIEAGIVLSQFWAERKRRILIILPSNLRKQWNQELDEKFFLPSVILETASFKAAEKSGSKNPFIQDGQIVLCSYHFASAKADYIKAINWDVVVIDEAHRLRNVYKKTNKIANAIKGALEGRKKILLTATPLQNSLLELYGLVSIVDDCIFGDRESFGSQYSKITSNGQFETLKARLAPICKRTLRRQVLEYIRYTKRIAMTHQFEPSEKETVLYNKVSEFLQRPNIQALPSGQRTLMTLVLRKLLASSTFAIAGAIGSMCIRLKKDLENMEKRLAAQGREQNDDVLLVDDYEGYDETADEWDEEDEPITVADVEAVRQEIRDLSEFHELAVSITENAKGEKLLSALTSGLEKTKELGGKEKAIIFTESKRTQNYVLDLLQRNGYKDQVVLFNGSNSDEKSKRIYKDWFEKNKNTDKVSGSKTADMRAALVDYFRNDCKIMIATEAAAEGINLQFCSLVVNYDLPWNPQRIEQRIGRCHRYGQNNDVVVVNFLNIRNEADRRVYELLDEKFKLFEGVFGASDEVLGSVESGVDFEKRILKILQSCRTSEEINSSFDKLRAELDTQIDEKMQSARRQLLENFDEEVNEKLKLCMSESETNLSKYQSMLYELTKWQLRNVARFDDEKKSFFLEKQPFTDVQFSTGPYSMAKAPHDEHYYRTHHPLAERILETAKSQTLNPAHVEFQYFGAPKISVLEEYLGKGGLLTVSMLTVEALEAEDRILFAGQADDGKEIDPEVCQRLFSLAGSIVSENVTADFSKLNHGVEALKSSLLEDIDKRNSIFFDQELEKLDKWAEDVKHSLEIELKQLDVAIKTKKTEAKKIIVLEEKVKAQNEIKELEAKRKVKRQNLFDEQDNVDKKKESLIEEVTSRLKQKVRDVPIFSVRWTLADKRRSNAR